MGESCPQGSIARTPTAYCVTGFRFGDRDGRAGVPGLPGGTGGALAARARNAASVIAVRADSGSRSSTTGPLFGLRVRELKGAGRRDRVRADQSTAVGGAGGGCTRAECIRRGGRARFATGSHTRWRRGRRGQRPDPRSTAVLIASSRASPEPGTVVEMVPSRGLMVPRRAASSRRSRRSATPRPAPAFRW